ncbi:hypothetical protein As57867_007772, partial [Aphanomyces stellatus]
CKRLRVGVLLGALHVLAHWLTAWGYGRLRKYFAYFPYMKNAVIRDSDWHDNLQLLKFVHEAYGRPGLRSIPDNLYDRAIECYLTLCFSTLTTTTNLDIDAQGFVV